ncbi:MAG: peroxidase-related enzyme [Candidatus Thermoplasmatota archaeon]|nr:peroxidase-related enzyme [Candidatus Thermoplasmatota archaeon]
MLELVRQMTYISIIDEQDAKDELKEIYQTLVQKRGNISNILKVHSLHPTAMKNHLDLYLSLMFNKSDLKREDKELIAVIVSSINHCEYCIRHHTDALRFYWKDEKKIEDVLLKKEASDLLSDPQKALVEFAVKLTKYPKNVNYEDVDRLKKNGFKDKDILEVVLISSYFNFVNRIALGLGVEVDEIESQGYRY